MNESNTTVAPTLNSRLASACNCAYGISATSGEYNAPKIYDAGVNWSEKPTPIAEREKGQDFGPYINACLVGLNQDGIIVAFRGTLPPAWTVASVEDWSRTSSNRLPVLRRRYLARCMLAFGRRLKRSGHAC